MEDLGKKVRMQGASLVIIIAVAAVLPAAASGLSANAAWRGEICTNLSVECTAQPQGDHDTTLADGPATGRLYLDGTLVDACEPSPVSVGCTTVGPYQDERGCQTALATTTADLGGDVEEDKANYGLACPD